MEKEEIVKIISNHFNSVEHLESVDNGNIKDVYFFSSCNEPYVISFSEHNNERNDKILHKLLGQDSGITNVVKYNGVYKRKFYTISNKIEGEVLSNYDSEFLDMYLNSVISRITSIHRKDIKKHNGYGWIKNGEGVYDSLKSFVTAMFHKDQVGYWENWYDLFNLNILNKEVFDELYAEIMKLLEFSTTRHLVHGDFFSNNIIISKEKTIHLIDWDNAMFCDSLYDVATLQMQFPHLKIKEEFKKYYEEHGYDTQNFNKRFRCMSLIKGLDGLRFYAKHGDVDTYKSVLKYLRSI